MDDLDGNADGKARKRKATAAEEAQARYCIHLSELQDLDIVLIRSRVQLNGVRMGYTVRTIIYWQALLPIHPDPLTRWNRLQRAYPKQPRRMHCSSSIKLSGNCTERCWVQTQHCMITSEWPNVMMCTCTDGIA